MNDDLDLTGAATLPDALYTLLPPAFRAADIAQGYPLLALSTVFDAVRTEIGDAILSLEQAWFAETCPDELVPLLGALLGAELGAHPIPEHRALVADLLGARRRKGIAAALPRLIHGNSGWRVLHASGTATPPATWPLPAAATKDEIGHAGLLRVWRRPAFPLSRVTPTATGPRIYACHPAGLPQILCNAPNTSLQWVAAPPITALPAALTAAMLELDLARWHQTWGDDGPPDSLLYGPARGLAIHVQDIANGPWRAIGPGALRALLIDGPVPPDYPALRSGAIDLLALTATTEQLTLTFGDAVADLTIAVPVAPSVAQLVQAVQTAIANAPVTPGTTVSEADVRAIVVTAAGSELVLVPTLAVAQLLTLTPVADGPDPLSLEGQAATGAAALTVPLTKSLIAALTQGPATTLDFISPDGQAVAVPLPLAAVPATVANIAAALAAAIPNSAAVAVGTQIVIVLASGPPTLQPPPPSPLAGSLGLTPLVTLDPERGQLAFPSALPLPAAIALDYAVAAPAGVGGLDGIGASPPLLANDAGDPAALGLAMASGVGGGLVLQGSATRSIGSQALTGPWVVVGDAGARPCLTIAAPGNLTVADGRLGLAQLLVVGSLALADGDVAIDLTDVTLLPAAGVPPAAGVAALAPAVATPPPQGTIELTATRCILGSLVLTGFTGTAAIVDSVISALPLPDRGAAALTAPVDCSVRLERTTLVGALAVEGPLFVQDSLCDGLLRCEAGVAISDSALGGLCLPATAEPPAAGAAVSWCDSCKKAASIALAPVAVVHLSLSKADLCSCATPAPGAPRDCGACDGSCGVCPLRGAGQSWSPLVAPHLINPSAYPAADFATLASDADPRLHTAASNRDEPGAYNRNVPTARDAGFERALREGLLVGVRPAVTYES